MWSGVRKSLKESFSQETKRIAKFPPKRHQGQFINDVSKVWNDDDVTSERPLLFSISFYLHLPLTHLLCYCTFKKSLNSLSSWLSEKNSRKNSSSCHAKKLQKYSIKDHPWDVIYATQNWICPILSSAVFRFPSLFNTLLLFCSADGDFTSLRIEIDKFLCLLSGGTQCVEQKGENRWGFEVDLGKIDEVSWNSRRWGVKCENFLVFFLSLSTLWFVLST